MVMQRDARIFGHPIHPMLTVFPMGLLPTAVLFDVLALATGEAHWLNISFYIIPVALLMGGVAALFGLVDWLGIRPRTRARRVGAVHGLGNAIVLALFGLSWLLRYGYRPQEPPVVAFAMAFAGVVLAAFTGWLGGELVDRLGIGVTPGAHADAPSSLRQPDPETPTPVRRW